MKKNHWKYNLIFNVIMTLAAVGFFWLAAQIVGALAIILTGGALW